VREQTKIKVGYVLDYVNEHIEQNGYPPSVREICAALGYKSTSTVHIYLKALEREGKIIKAPSKPRTLRVMRPDENDGARPADSAVKQTRRMQIRNRAAGTHPAIHSQGKPGGANDHFAASDETVYVPVIGRVTAGKPIFALENIEYTFPVPSFFTNSANVFMLKVEGDSMINAGIFDRDFILVRHQPTAQNGEIVVALIGDEATVKTFYKEHNRIRLQPENELYSPIYATGNCTIVGKVIGIFRKI
jgi:repressor LexA